MSPRKYFLVVDTNLLISALFIRSTTARHVLASLQIRGQLVFSSATFAELEKKIRMAKFDRFTSCSEREAAVEALRISGMFIEPEEYVRLCRDPNDDMFLSLAKTANVCMLVTGDKDLLTLHKFDRIPIMTPQEALCFDWSED